MAKMSKKKYCLECLKTNWNVLSANYNGFEWTLKLEHRFNDQRIIVQGDCHDIWIGTTDKKDAANSASVLTYEFAKNIGHIINKNARNYKDPFKGITGWCG